MDTFMNRTQIFHKEGTSIGDEGKDHLTYSMGTSSYPLGIKEPVSVMRARTT